MKPEPAPIRFKLNDRSAADHPWISIEGGKRVAKVCQTGRQWHSEIREHIIHG